MIIIDFLNKLNQLNDMKLLFAKKIAERKGGYIYYNKTMKKEIEAKINKLQLNSKSLASFIETKWVSSFQILSKMNKNPNKTKMAIISDGKANDDDQDEDDHDIMKNNKHLIPITPPHDEQQQEQEEDEEDENVDENEDSNIELGGTANTLITPLPDDNENENDNDGKDESKRSLHEESEIDLELQHFEKMSFRDKLKNIDKESMREKLNLLKKTSSRKLNIVGKKLKQIAKEELQHWENLSEKAKLLMNRDKDIKYDSDGNILDTEIFVIRPKNDNRIMTCDDEKRWLKLKSESVIDIHDDDQVKQRQKTSEEIQRDQENNDMNKKKESKARIFMRKKSSEIFKKIELKTKQFKERRNVINNNNNNNNGNQTKSKRFQFKGFAKSKN